jgi:hypothetical protein
VHALYMHLVLPLDVFIVLLLRVLLRTVGTAGR